MSEVLSGLRTWTGQNHKTIAIVIGGIFITVKVTSKIKEKLNNIKTQQMLKKWEDGPKNVVILHTLSRGKTVPNLSPFAMKLETFLRMANVKYQLDFHDPCGPVGKTPWITYNGQHIADSQIIIDFLSREHNVTIGNYTEQQRAVAKAVRIVMDEYLYWGIGLWRYVYSEGRGLNALFDMPESTLRAFHKSALKRVQDSAWKQGIGRHSQEQVIQMMKDVLHTISLILADNRFLLGDEPCEQDCSLFGFLSMVMWATPESPYEKYLIDELPNLKEYCIRMKEHFWVDWEECLAIPN